MFEDIVNFSPSTLKVCHKWSFERLFVENGNKGPLTIEEIQHQPLNLLWKMAALVPEFQNFKTLVLVILILLLNTTTGSTYTPGPKAYLSPPPYPFYTRSNPHLFYYPAQPIKIVIIKPPKFTRPPKLLPTQKNILFDEP